MARAIAAVPSHQPSSRTYQVMIAVSYYAGLRPSEVVMLRPRALHLPVDGWGRIDVVEADIDFDVALAISAVLVLISALVLLSVKLTTRWRSASTSPIPFVASAPPSS